MRTDALVGMLVLTLLLSSSHTASGDVDEDRRIPPTDDTIGGSVWSRDMRLTFDPAEDRYPHVTVDGYKNTHLVWQRSGTWTRTYDSMGYPLSKEVFITPHYVSGYGDPNRYPLGPGVAIDSQANIHVTWDDGWQNIYYQKFDPRGNAITNIIHVGNEDNTASHVPAIAIDPINDYVHIVHEDYEYQCEDIVYDKLDNNGKILVNEVSVSNDVSSHCEHCTLTTDVLGNIHVAFGTGSGTWWRKVDQNGVARGHSVNLMPFPMYMIADIACTPNGDVHSTWLTNGSIYYTRMDNNGTFLNEEVEITKNSVWPGSPRIAAAHDSNTVYIVWSDARDGNSEIYFAKMEEGRYDITPENYRLTRNPSQSIFPRITLDDDDNVHVVWQDYRDGNSEIYYKFMFNFKLELAPVDVSELANMYFFHPNDTKVLPLYIKNLGLLPDDYRVTLSYDDDAKADGWVVDLDKTEFDRVPGGSKVYLNLTTSCPVNAIAGDHVNITVNATSLSAKDVWDSLSWRSFAIVVRDVAVLCEEPTKRIEPPYGVIFQLNITNIGDVPDTYGISLSMVPDNAGWEVTVDKERVVLSPDDTTSITVHLRPPRGVKDNETGTVHVRVQSLADASVWSGKKLLGIVNPAFSLDMEVREPIGWVDPGGMVTFPITVRNVGNMAGKLSVYLTSSDPTPGWDAFLNSDTMALAGGEEQVLLLVVTAPSDALAGFRQTLRVKAVTEDLSSRADLEVTVFVKRVYGLDISLDLAGIGVYPGEVARQLMTVTNLGNGLETVPLVPGDTPPGYIVTFEHDEAEITDLVLMSKGTKTVSIMISTPYDAISSRPTVEVVLTDGSGHRYPVRFNFRIYQIYAVDLSSSQYHAWGGPRGVVDYPLTLSNEGNGEDIFVLDHSGLPMYPWRALFTDLTGEPIGTIILGPYESADILLRVFVPEDAFPEVPLELAARATSTSAMTDEVKLTLEVRLPDLRIQAVEYDPQRLRPGETVMITLLVVNEGDHPAEDVRVVFMVDDQEKGSEEFPSIIAPGNVTVSFPWSPKPGRHDLTFRVTSEVPEQDLDNNVLVHQKTVPEEASSPGLGAWAVLGVLVCVLVALRARGR